MAFHQHNYTEIMYLISGSCVVEVRVDDRPVETYRLKRGELIVLDASVPHRLIVEETCRMLNVEFGFVSQPGYAPPINQMAQKTSSLNELMENTFSSLILSDTGEIYRVLKALVLELDQAGADDKYIVHLLFCELLLRVAEQRKEQLNARERPAQLYVRKSIEFLHQNYDRSIQAKDVAAAVNLHHGYLHRIFKSHTGRTLTDYLTMLRMEKAKQLLGQSDISVAEIADYVGISSRQYFHLLFRKYTGQTPSNYRDALVRDSWAKTNISQISGEDF